MGFVWFVILGLLGFVWEGFWWLLGIGVALHIILLLMEIGLAYKERREQEELSLGTQAIHLGQQICKSVSLDLERALQDKRVSSFCELLNTYKTAFEDPAVAELFKEDMHNALMLGHMTLIVAIDAMGESASKAYKVLVSDPSMSDNLWICVSCMVTDYRSGDTILNSFNEYAHIIYAVDTDSNRVEYRLVHLNDLDDYIDTNAVLPFKTVQSLAKQFKAAGL